MLWVLSIPLKPEKVMVSDFASWLTRWITISLVVLPEAEIKSLYLPAVVIILGLKKFALIRLVEEVYEVYLVESCTN